MLDDGHGNLWEAACPECGERMQIMRPGEVQCPNEPHEGGTMDYFTKVRIRVKDVAALLPLGEYDALRDPNGHFLVRYCGDDWTVWKWEAEELQEASDG